MSTKSGDEKKAEPKAAVKKAAPGLKYAGGGFLPDVPARDLSTEEADKLGRKALLASGLYSEE